MSVDLADLTPTERQTWRETGDLPEPKSTPSVTPIVPEADSTPAKPAEQAVSTEPTTPPASEPGTPKNANAATRIKDLLAENKRLQQQLAMRPSPDRPASTSDVSAASSPAVEVPSLASIIDAPDLSHPVLTDAAFFSAYPEATVGDYARYAASYQFERKQAAAQESQARTDLTAKFSDRLKSALATDPEFFTKTEAVAAITPYSLLPPGQAAQPEHFMAEEILRSERPAALMLHLADHPEMIETIRAGTALEAIRTIARLEGTFALSSVPAQPVVKTTPSAPPPPPTLGSKPAQAGDELEDAVKRGDMRAYRRIMNAREAAG